MSASAGWSNRTKAHAPTRKPTRSRAMSARTAADSARKNARCASNRKRSGPGSARPSQDRCGYETRVPRLRRSDCAAPGITRRRNGRGFIYINSTTGERVTDAATLQRIDDLSIPPAWQDVWICPQPNGHIQATGTDARGRRQYRYHDVWRAQRDRMKFDRVLEFGAALP